MTSFLFAGRLHILRRGSRCALVALALAWLAGAVHFLMADGSLRWQPPRAAPPPEGLHNLALYRWGPTLRASSYFRDSASHHHPAFLVDGEDDPSLIEKWASHPRDPAPWVEIRWDEPRDVRRVKIWHASFREPRTDMVSAYRLRCLDGRPDAPALDVQHDRSAIASHLLSCPDARGLRIDWEKSRPEHLVRVYEIEVWGS